ncbi:hypothetical protein POKO110462_00600 [Pontibacter korlensis]
MFQKFIYEVTPASRFMGLVERLNKKGPVLLHRAFVV